MFFRKNSKKVSFLIGILSVGLVSTTLGAPGDVFQVTAPVLGGNEGPESRDIEIGDATVSTQTGAFQYSYPISVPPGRNLTPSLALGYTSQGSTYGSAVGSGWSLSGLHWIEYDTSQGRLADEPRWKSTLGGGRRLVEVGEPIAPDASRAYRVADGDGSYTRYQRIDRHTWRALTTDGKRYTFGESSNLQGHETYYRVPLTSVEDGFGNRMDYLWEPVYLDGDQVDFRIAQIVYTSHPEVDAFARVNFEYVRPQTCPGTGIPVGAHLDYRYGAKSVRGADKLVAITTEVRDDGWRPVREYELEYYDDNTDEVNSERCDQPYSPVRMLESVQETAHTPPQSLENSAEQLPQVTEMPPVTFHYGPLERKLSTTQDFDFGWQLGMEPVLGYGQRAKGHTWPTIDVMLLDFDGDGRQDRLMMSSDGSCSFVWQKNVGTGFETDLRGPVQLPTLPTSGDEREHCSLSGQLSFYENLPGADGACVGKQNIGAYLAYRFLDMDGDRRPELVTAIHHDPRWLDPNEHQFAKMMGGWPDCSPDAQCPVLEGDCMRAAYDCDRDGSCGFNPDVTNQCLDAAQITSCDRMFMNPRPFCDYYCSEEFEFDDNPGGGQCPDQRVAHQRCGRYPWTIYWNQGGGTLSDVGEVKLQPVPLESSGGDSNVGPGRFSSQSHALQDIDGDGFVDVVTSVKLASWAPDVSDPNWWFVFRGDGTGGFHMADTGYPYIWNAPESTHPAWTHAYNPSPDSEVKFSATAGALIDMNADGLPDLVTRPKQRVKANENPFGYRKGLYVYYNTGVGFRTGPVDDQEQHARRLATTLTHPMAARIDIDQEDDDGWVEQGTRRSVFRSTDVDGDGRVDFFREWISCTSDSSCGSRLLRNAGDGVAAEVAFVDDKVHRGLRRRVLATPGNGPWGDWAVTDDFVDIDGDGQPEYVHTSPSGVEVWTQDEPLRLLERVENGHGGYVDVHYAASNDPAVDANPQTDPDNPQVQWVVDSLTTGDAFGSPPVTTSYAYEAPVFSRDPHTGTYGFRGFERVRTHTANGAVTEAHYGYDVDWSGRQNRTITYRDDSLSTVASISQTEWQELQLFSGKVVSYKPQIERTWTCRQDRTVSECRSDGMVERTDTTWEPIDSVMPVSPLPAQVYVATDVRLSGSNSTAPQIGDRFAEISYELYSDEETYRLRTKETRKRALGDDGYEVWGHTEHEWVDDGLWKQATTNWRDANTPSTTKRGVDSVGNVVWDKDPNQVAKGTAGKKVHYEYDDARVHVTDKTNELGHFTRATVDLGTGATLRTIGPNVKVITQEMPCIPSWPPWSSDCEPETTKIPVFFESRTDIDGFGRPLIEYTSVDDGEGYAREPIAFYEYDDFAYVDDGERTSVLERRYVDFDTPSSATETESFYDGQHRLVETRTATYLGDDAITRYYYDEAGNLDRFETPSPAVDSGQWVNYHYQYDSLGRVTEIIRPGGSGQETAYDGLERTITEIVSDGGPQAKKRLVHDVFGRLREVHERVGQGGGEVFTEYPTQYDYDPNDNLRRAVDSDGVMTELAHDWVGNRIRITREGQRTWRYRYDRNGNMEARVAPYDPSEGESEVDYTTTIVYDALDRPLSKITGVGDMSEADVARVGADAWLDYDYDEGANAIGRLSAQRVVRDGGPPLVETRYSYDARGNAIEEARSFNLASIGHPQLSDTRVIERSYNALGKPSSVHYGDGTTTSDPTHVTFHYGRRGMLGQAFWHHNGMKILGGNQRNMAGRVTRRVLGNGAISNWTYDRLGRVIHQDVVPENGQPAALQSLTYYDSGDPKQLVNVLDGTQHIYDFDYDHQHQLVSAEGTDGFTQSMSYHDSGRIDTAYVAEPGDPTNTVTPRDVFYEYGNNAEAHQVTGLVGQDGSDLVRYTYDDAGNIIERTREGDSWQQVYDGFENQRIVRHGDDEELYFYADEVQRALAFMPGEYVRLWHGPLEVWYTLDGNVSKTWAHASIGTTTVRIENGDDAEYTLHSTLQHALVSLDEDGEVAAGFNYAPFGELLSRVGATKSHPKRFNNKDYDAVSGLHYYGYRYYDQLGLIWTQADPLFRFVPDMAYDEPRRMGLYSFNLNNPLRYLDPDGLCPAAGANMASADCSEAAPPAMRRRAEIAKSRAIYNQKSESLWPGVASAARSAAEYSQIGSVVSNGWELADAVVKGDWERVKATSKKMVIEAVAGKGGGLVVKWLNKGKKTGSYTIFFKSEKKYHGKGPPNRAKKSARERADKHDDEVDAIDHTDSPSDRDAFKDEAERIRQDDGVESPDNYNEINSPGERYLQEDEKKLE